MLLGVEEQIQVYVEVGPHLVLLEICVASLLLGGLTVRDPASITVTPPHKVSKYARHLGKGEPSNPLLTAGPRPHTQCRDLAG